MHTVQTTSSKELGGKNKIKAKYKKSSIEQGGEKSQQPPTEGSTNKCKFKNPFMICKEDYFMKDCPRLAEIHQYLKRGGSSSQPAVLTNHFPPQNQQMVS